MTLTRTPRVVTASILDEIASLLPEDARVMAASPFIPWPWVVHRHRDRPPEKLAALFRAYAMIVRHLDIHRVVRGVGPAGEEDDCRRCGSCCAELVPDPVYSADVQAWEDTGNPLARFYAPEEGVNGPSRMTGWTFEGTRLRLCPFLLWHPEHGDTFCALHHLGPEARPEACSGFVPRYPHCAICQRPVVW